MRDAICGERKIATQSDTQSRKIQPARTQQQKERASGRSDALGPFSRSLFSLKLALSSVCAPWTMSAKPSLPVPPVAGPSTLKRSASALDGDESGDDDALASAGPALTPVAPVKATVTARDGKPYFTVTTTDGAPGVEATLQDLKDGQPGQKPPVRA